MSSHLLVTAPLGLLPVLALLGVLIYMDSYKLVRPRLVLAVIGAGCLLAVAGYFINSALRDLFDLSVTSLSRYAGPVTEESLKALVIVYLLRNCRIGFLVDSAILGFAVGTGFALGENLYYLASPEHGHHAIWVVRGFGTAIMHGGATAIFAVLTQVFSDRHLHVSPLACLPGLLAAVAVHSLFNHFVLPPVQMTLLFLATLPALLYGVFLLSAHHLHHWLELDFDDDARFIRQLTSGQFGATRAGQFMTDLKTHFDGPVLVDMLCYLRVYTELALRAKGLLMMRQNGLEAPVDEQIREKFAELEHLENSIGRTGLLAIRPLLHMRRRDLWQLRVLD